MQVVHVYKGEEGEGEPIVPPPRIHESHTVNAFPNLHKGTVIGQCQLHKALAELSKEESEVRGPQETHGCVCYADEGAPCSPLCPPSGLERVS